MIHRRLKNARICPDHVFVVVDDDAVTPPQRLLAFQVPRIPNVEFAQVNGHDAKGSGGNEKVRIERTKNFQAEDGLVADEVALLDVAQRVQPVACVGEKIDSTGSLSDDEQLSSGVPSQCGRLASAHAADGGNALHYLGALVQGEHGVLSSHRPEARVQVRSAMDQFFGLVVGQVVRPRAYRTVFLNVRRFGALRKPSTDAH